MTRETKVGLLVGMGVILLIGIIVSDYLSQAYRQQSASLTRSFEAARSNESPRSASRDSRSPRAASPSRSRPTRRPHGQPAGGQGIYGSEVRAMADPRPNPNSQRARAIDHGSGEPTPVRAQPPGQAGDSPYRLPAALARQPGSPAPPSRGGARLGDAAPTATELPASRRHLKEDRSASSASTSYASTPATDRTGGNNPSRNDSAPPTLVLRSPQPAGSRPWPPTHGSNSPLPSTSRNVNPSKDDPASPLDASASSSTSHAAPDPDSPSADSASSSKIIHYVKEGETLFEIARDYYGSGEYWRVIARYNADRIRPGGQVNSGVRLVLPNKAGLAKPDGQADLADREGFESAGSERALRLDGPGATPSADESSNPRRTIQVKSGDTLIQLARRHLGDAGQWKRLMKSNADQLASPEDLRAGMTLRLPGEDAASSRGAGNATSDGQASTYTVQSGDTLIGIAEQVLDRGEGWRALYQLNQDRLEDPSDLHAGQTLRLPS